MDVTTHTPGAFCTTVLRTGDLERAAAFYTALVGWTSQEVPGTPGHRLLQFGGRTVASLHQISNESDIWVPHISVESVERTTADALALGATLVDAADIPGLARLATLRGPEGALFGLWQPAPYQGAQLTEDVGQLVVDRGALEQRCGRTRVLRTPLRLPLSTPRSSRLPPTR